MKQNTDQLQQLRRGQKVNDRPNHWILCLERNLQKYKCSVFDADSKTIMRHCCSFAPDSNSYTGCRRLTGRYRVSMKSVQFRFLANLLADYRRLISAHRWVERKRFEQLSQEKTQRPEHLVAPAVDHFKAAAAPCLLSTRRTRVWVICSATRFAHGYSHFGAYSGKHQRLLASDVAPYTNSVSVYI